MTNIIMAKNSQDKNTTVSYYLDTAAELSKLNRKNHKQVSDKGVPLMYDLEIEITTPLFSNSNEPNLTGTVFTAPDHWVTRNAVRMAHFTREDLRKEAGVKKESIGRYAKNLRMNLNASMASIAYTSSTSAGTETAKRIYAQNETPWNSGAGNDIAGGTWDYTQLAQVDPTDRSVGDVFTMSVCGQHSASAPGPYTRIGVNFAYLQRRQTVQADATMTSGGDTVNVNTQSPFFRIPEQDESEDAYQTIAYDEQDNPPYDRLISGSASDAADYAPIVVDTFQLTSGTQDVARLRVQAPLGLVQLKLDSANSDSFSDVHFRIVCHGVYEM